MAEEDQPPYVEFVTKAVEDRNASIEAGHYIGTDKDYAVVTARGSRDRVEHEIDVWFKKIEDDVRALRIPQRWASQWKEAYQFWKKGEELSEGGTSIKSWPVASPAQINTLTAIRVMSVEQLAAANEETLARLGLGGRALQQKAKDWLIAAAGPGKQTEEIGKLRIDLERAQQTIATLTTQNQQLRAQVQANGNTSRAAESVES